GAFYWVMRCVKSGSWTITPAPPAPLAGSRSGEHPNSQGCASTHDWQQYTTLPSRTPRSTAIGQPHFGQVKFAISPSTPPRGRARGRPSSSDSGVRRLVSHSLEIDGSSIPDPVPSPSIVQHVTIRQPVVHVIKRTMGTELIVQPTTCHRFAASPGDRNGA